MKRGLIFYLIFFASSLYAQSYDFNGYDVIKNQTVSLSDYFSYKGVVIIFISNHCPYSVLYENRISRLVKQYNDKTPFILINSHTQENESMDEMRKKMKTLNLSIPYLSDKTSGIKNVFKAIKSPECFVLKINNRTTSIYYKGAIDNNPQLENDVNHFFLRESLDNLLADKTIILNDQSAVGCTIR